MKFNRKKKSNISAKTVNRAGGEAYKQSDKLALTSLLLTSFVKAHFYRSEDEQIKNARELIGKIADKKFAAKAAIYARNTFGMRSITHVAAAEIAKTVKGEEWTKNFYYEVVRRPDDILEVLALAKEEKSIPNSLKKGLRRAFDKFDGYQIAKYRGENKEVSLVDAVNLLHPTPTKENKAALKKLVEGKLVSKDTWESELTKAGQKAETDEEKKELKADVWKSLLKEKNLGYFALLRNLRNIEQQAPEMITEAAKQLVNKDAIKKSLVLPFRFTEAIQHVTDRRLKEAISDALDISLSNVPTFEGKTLIVLDGSGSMDGKPIEIGSLFAAVLYKANPDADFICFASDAHYIGLNSRNSVIGIRDEILNRRINGGTNFKAILTTANKRYDRIVILSDMQGWVGYNTPDSEFRTYCKTYKADPYVYSFDLQGYGDMQFPENKVLAIAGFSDKVFDVMKLLEDNQDALIEKIEKVSLK